MGQLIYVTPPAPTHKKPPGNHNGLWRNPAEQRQVVLDNDDSLF